MNYQICSLFFVKNQAYQSKYNQNKNKEYE